MPSTWPLGVLRAGVVATIDERAVLQVGGQRHSVRLWVSGVDRWRTTETEPTLRHRTVGDAPVHEWTVRVPGGDVSWSTFGFVPAGGGDAPAIALGVHNDSTEPVAVALVVGPVREAQLRGDSLVADGEVVARFARAPRGLVRGATPERVAAVLDAGGVEPLVEGRPPDDSGSAGAGSGELWVAAVAPLPHTATYDVVVGHGGGWGDTFPIPPTATAVATGWSAHAEQGTRLEPADPVVEGAWRQAVTTLALISQEVAPEHVAAVGAAVARLGWRSDAAGLATRAMAAQRRSGEVGGSPEDTIDAVDLWSTMVGLDLTDEGIDQMVLPLASAAGWLAHPRRSRRLPDVLRARAASALRRAAAAMARAGEERAAADLAAAAGQVGPSGAAQPDAKPPLDGTPSELARWITDTIDAHVAAGPDGVSLLEGWTSALAGRSIEVHDAETPWGRVGYAIRWHGRRPALLWEAVEPASTIRWTCPVIDPAWSSTDATGETLLAEPEGLPELDLVESSTEVLADPSAADAASGAATEPEPPTGPMEGESFA